jgi:hypothetical protein
LALALRRVEQELKLRLSTAEGTIIPKYRTPSVLAPARSQGPLKGAASPLGARMRKARLAPRRRPLTHADRRTRRAVLGAMTYAARLPLRPLRIPPAMATPAALPPTPAGRRTLALSNVTDRAQHRPLRIPPAMATRARALRTHADRLVQALSNATAHARPLLRPFPACNHAQHAAGRAVTMAARTHADKAVALRRPATAGLRRAAVYMARPMAAASAQPQILPITALPARSPLLPMRAARRRRVRVLGTAPTLAR